MQAVLIEDSIRDDGNTLLIDVKFDGRLETMRLPIETTAEQLQQKITERAEAIQQQLDATAAKQRKAQTIKDRFAALTGREITIDGGVATVGKKVGTIVLEESPLSGDPNKL